MDCMVCSGYVTVVATTLATAPMMKTSAEDSLQEEDDKTFIMCKSAANVQISTFTGTLPVYLFKLR